VLVAARMLAQVRALAQVRGLAWATVQARAPARARVSALARAAETGPGQGLERAPGRSSTLAAIYAPTLRQVRELGPIETLPPGMAQELVRGLALAAELVPAQVPWMSPAAVRW
jgi:hypothetical protein